MAATMVYHATEEHLITLKTFYDLEQTCVDGRKRARRNQVTTYPFCRQSLNIAHQGIGMVVASKTEVKGKGGSVHCFCSSNSTLVEWRRKELHRRQRTQLLWSDWFLIWCSLARKSKNTLKVISGTLMKSMKRHRDKKVLITNQYVLITN